MRIRSLVLLSALGVGAGILLAPGRDVTVSMHPDDWRVLAGGESRRRYIGAGQLLHHVRELAGLLVPVSEVYLLRAISPAFREQIMIVTALSNDCSP